MKKSVICLFSALAIAFIFSLINVCLHIHAMSAGQTLCEVAYTVLILLSAIMVLWSTRIEKHLIAAMYFALFGMFIKFLIWGAAQLAIKNDTLSTINGIMNIVIVVLAFAIGTGSAHVLFKVRDWKKIVEIISFCTIGLVLVLLITNLVHDIPLVDSTSTKAVMALVFEKLTLAGTAMIPLLSFYVMKTED